MHRGPWPSVTPFSRHMVGVSEPAAVGRRWEETPREEEAARSLVLASLLERKAGEETSGLSRP